MVKKIVLLSLYGVLLQANLPNVIIDASKASEWPRVHSHFLNGPVYAKSIPINGEFVRPFIYQNTTVYPTITTPKGVFKIRYNHFDNTVSIVHPKTKTFFPCLSAPQEEKVDKYALSGAGVITFCVDAAGNIKLELASHTEGS